MNLKSKILIFFIVLFSFATLMEAQQVTREQLMKLFFKANTAMNQNRDKEAIDAFLEIVSCSPNLSDPYMQLGKLYSKDESNLDALKKAVICYDNYLKLNPDSEEKAFIQNEIARLNGLIEALDKPVVAVAPVIEDTVPVEINEEPVAVIALVENSDIEFEEENIHVELSDSVAPLDSVFVVSVDSVVTRPVAKVQSSMLGRWSSLAQMDNGRDLWIVDILAESDTMWLCVVENSYVIENNEITDYIYKVPGYAEDEMVSFEFEFRKNMNDFGNYSDFDIALDKMFGHSGNSESSLNSVEQRNSESYKLYKYRFKLEGGEKKLSGNISKNIYDSMLEIESDTITEVLDLYKVPEDYTGYSFPLLSDDEKAMKLEFRDIFNRNIKESAKSVSAVNDLGCMYANGIGTRKNMKMAVSYFVEASMKNNLFAMLNLADLYMRGLGVEKNIDKARELYNRAFESGYTDAMVLCGDTYIEGAVGQEPDYEKAVSCYQQAILKNCPYAAYRLGWLYSIGLGVEKNIEKALSYYEKAIAMNYEDAMFDIGVLYREGEMVEKNDKKAFEYLLKACDRGCTAAMYELYLMYMTGNGVEQNYNLAETWLSKYMKKANIPYLGFSTLKSEINAILNK